MKDKNNSTERVKKWQRENKKKHAQNQKKYHRSWEAAYYVPDIAKVFTKRVDKSQTNRILLDYDLGLQEYNEKDNENMKIYEFTDEFIDDLTNKWIAWLIDGFVFDEDGNQVAKAEVPRLTYIQFKLYAKQFLDLDLSLVQIDNERKLNTYFAEKMAEIDKITEELLVTYTVAERLTNANSKFLLTNIFPNKWKDVKRVETETTIIDEITWTAPSLPQMDLSPSLPPLEIEYEEVNPKKKGKSKK